MQLVNICKRIKKIENFEIVCIQSTSQNLPNLFYSYFEGSHILSNDFNLEAPVNNKNSFLTLNSNISIHDYENHFKQRNYTYAILEYCYKSSSKEISHHKVTRSSNKEILDLTSLTMKANSSNKKNKKSGLLSIQNKDDLDSFFKIENYESIGNIKHTGAKFLWSLENINYLRESNRRAGKLLNFSMPYTDTERLRYNYLKDILNIEALEQYLQRYKKVFKNYELDYKAYKKKQIALKEENKSFENKITNEDDLFLSIISKGIDPLTGELFPEGHAWLHPKIMSDIKEYLKIKESFDHAPKIKTKKRTGILRDIKRSIKAEYDIDLVLIESGAYVRILEEDAQYFFDNFEFKQNNSYSFPSTGFPTTVLKRYIKILKNKKIKFCFISQNKQKIDNKKGYIILRKVEYSDDQRAFNHSFET